MNYVLCYCDMSSGKNAWECVSGEDAMHKRVSELCDSGQKPEDIMVFEQNDEIDIKTEQDGGDPINEIINHIFEVIDKSLALAGFKILEGDNDTVYVRHPASDSSFKVKIGELVN